MLKSLVEVVGALVEVSTRVRGWYGRLSQWEIARAMSCAGTAKSRYKRLGRFMGNRRLDSRRLMMGLVGFSGVAAWGQIVPLLVDQTSLCGDAVQAIVASFVCGTRAIPLAMETFEKVCASGSQNVREWNLLQRVVDGLRGCVRFVLVMDRGYAKAVLIERLLQRQVPFVIRVCRNVIVQYHDGGAKRCALERLPHKQGSVVRYHDVRYLEGGRICVDVVVFRGRGFAEPWYLIVPPKSCMSLPDEQVLDWYRWRMRIEVSFRDFKSWLGARGGLRFVADPAEKMARMLVCLAIAYTILLALSQTGEARRVRAEMEVRRRRSRHGTRRTLSALTVALLTVIKAVAGHSGGLASLLSALMACWTCGVHSPGLDEIVLH